MSSLADAVRNARKPVELEAAGEVRLAYKVSDIPGADDLPRALVSILENVIRNSASDEDAIRAAESVIAAGKAGTSGAEIEFMPARVLFQDLTGVPVFVDFAAMRDEVKKCGGDPSLINPLIPCTLVIDHSVVADCSGTKDACDKNVAIEIERNRERFEFLKWASKSFDNVEIVPPGVGICHQLNIERFSPVVAVDALSHEAYPVACFDTLVGTDSHTTTANGIGVLGWGVGGIEAEAASLGQPITMLVPAVVELRLEGEMPRGTSGMDLALRVAQLLREAKVVGDIVEVTGPGVAKLSATQRACVANMTPEYGATSTLFPVDDEVVSYLELTGRKSEDIAFVRAYNELQNTYGAEGSRTYARTVTLDLSTIEPSLAGPSRPHDRVSIAGLRERVRTAAVEHEKPIEGKLQDIEVGNEHYQVDNGVIALAAVTSCTTATDPAMMIQAGLLAKKAVEAGLSPKAWVKKVLAPGSQTTELLLENAGLIWPLQQLGFFTCGFGCMSCIGNSGEIYPALHALADTMELTSVLSGNRNFEGRISPDVSQNYLCNPAMVIAYSLVGTMDVDLSAEPIGTNAEGQDIYLSDIMPTDAEISAVLQEQLTPELFAAGAESLFEGGRAWSEVKADSSDTFAWDPQSTYVRHPPYFEIARPGDTFVVNDARVLVDLGDFVTTDHISPAGSIAKDSPASRYLTEHGVEQRDFSSYGARRGNHEVMMRGTFANVKLDNSLAEGRIGCWTLDQLDNEIKSVFDASIHYQDESVELIVLAGKLYGSGSSRDWAGKGPALLGVRAVIAETFERIHRSNLIGMGILPLQFEDGQSAKTLGLTGHESYSVEEIDVSNGLPDKHEVRVVATSDDGSAKEFKCVVRIDTPTEGRYLQAGGILPFVLDSLGK